MKIVVIATDDRDERSLYDRKEPLFGTAVAALLEGMRELSDCEVHLVCCVRRAMGASAQIGDNLHYRPVLVPQMGWLRTGYSGCIRSIRKELQNIRPDIVHGQGTERYCALSAVKSGYPNVVTIHGNMARMGRFAVTWTQKLFYWIAGCMERHALRMTDGVFCNSSYTESLVKPYARKLWRVPNALRAALFLPLPAKIANPKPVLLNIGTVAPHKQQLEILRWARKLHDQGCQFDLRFIGAIASGTDYGRLFKSEVAAAQACGFARYVGTRGTEDLLSQLDQADALVHCSQEESFGLVVAEALARNLKFFGMNTGGVADIAMGVDGADVVAFGDWGGLEQCVRGWLIAGGTAPRLAASVMRERYHPRVVACRHLEIYQEVLGKQGRR